MIDTNNRGLIGSYPFRQYLDTIGDGTGFINANGNYSSGSPGIFKFIPHGINEYAISKLVIGFIQNSNTENSADQYASTAKLTNGIKIEFIQNIIANKKISLIGQAPILSTDDYSRCGFVSHIPLFETQNIANAGGPFSFAFCLNLFDEQLLLLSGSNQAIQITCQDNLSSLQTHSFFIAGAQL